SSPSFLFVFSFFLPFCEQRYCPFNRKIFTYVKKLFLSFFVDMLAFKQYLQKHTPVNDEQFAALLPELREKQVVKGDILLQEGATNSHSYFVCSGLLRAYTLNEQGKEHTLQFAPENWWLS